MRSGLERGFTLVEVMLALAILFAGLVVLIRSTAGNIYTADRSYMLGVATDLARGKMYDLEEELLREGFTDRDVEESGDFADEGWPHIRWEAVVIRPEIPDLAGMAEAMRDDEPLPGAEDTGGALGAGLEMGMEASGGGIASLIPPFVLTMLQGVLEEAIRKVELTITWDAVLGEQSMLVEAYFTEPKHVNEVVGGLGQLAPGAGDSGDGAGDEEDEGGGRGSRSPPRDDDLRESR